MKTKSIKIMLTLVVSIIFSVVGYIIISNSFSQYQINWSLILHISCILCVILFISITPEFSFKQFYKPFLLLLLILGPTTLLVSELEKYNLYFLITSLATWTIISVVYEIKFSKSQDVTNESLFIVWLLSNSILTLGKLSIFGYTTELIYQFNILGTFYDLRLWLTIIFGFSIIITSFVRGANKKYIKKYTKYKIKQLPNNNSFEYFYNVFVNFNISLRNYIKESINFLKFYLTKIGNELKMTILNLLNNWLKVFSFVIVFLLTIILSKILFYFSSILINYLYTSSWTEISLYVDLASLIIGFILIFFFVFALKYFINIIYYKSDIVKAVNVLLKSEISVFWSFFILIASFIISGIILAFIPSFFSDEIIFQKYNIPLFTLLTAAALVLLIVIFNIQYEPRKKAKKLDIKTKLSIAYRNILGTRANIYQTVVVMFFLTLIFYILYDTYFNNNQNEIDNNVEVQDDNTNNLDTRIINKVDTINYENSTYNLMIVSDSIKDNGDSTLID